MCRDNFKMNSLVLGVVILVFALWQTAFSQWVIVAAAVLLVICALFCKRKDTVIKEMPKKSKKKK